MSDGEDKLSFEVLFGDDNSSATALFLLWANDFLGGFGVSDSVIDQSKAFSFVSNLRTDDFPANGGFEAASPFKKAAHIYVWLHAINPFIGSISSETVGDISVHSHSTASLVGFGLVQRCLHGAELERNGQKVTIEKPINISMHFFKDLVEASRGISPSDHFKIYSLLFESLVYDSNDGLSYDRVFV